MAAGPAPRRARSRRETPGLPVRRLAAEVVGHVLKARAALDDTLDATLAEAGLDARDGALVRAIATATFRHLGSLRAALAARLDTGLPAKSGPLEAILLTAAAQILHLEAADHAAVDLAVDLAREDNRSAPYAKLANAVLRRLAREREAALDARDPLRDDTPDWLARGWIAAYGEARARDIAAANAREAGLDLSVKPSHDPVLWAERLGAALLPGGSLRLVERMPVRDLPGYAEGAWWVQDAAAAIPARLLDVMPGERVLDLCAAPGGKTAQLAAAGGEVTAVDRSAARLARLSENLARLGLSATVLAADTATLDVPPAPAVLLDAPCSATGTLRRHPDSAWTKRPEDVARLAALQARLLDRAAALTAPGGRLVYCTCSLEPEEGEAQAEAFLARHRGFRRRPVRPEEMPGLAEAITASGDVRLLPSFWPHEEARRAGIDGFFVARFERRA